MVVFRVSSSGGVFRHNLSNKTKVLPAVQSIVKFEKLALHSFISVENLSSVCVKTLEFADFKFNLLVP